MIINHLGSKWIRQSPRLYLVRQVYRRLIFWTLNHCITAGEKLRIIKEKKDYQSILCF